MNREATRSLIYKHEGMRHVVYLDSKGIMTIGVGFNLERPGARQKIAACGVDYNQLCSGATALKSAEQVDSLFEDDLDEAIEDAITSVSNFIDQPDEVQMVIVDMVFNLGVGGFRAFKKTIAALEAKDYETAANEMQNSKWAEQVPNRAAENIRLVRQSSRHSTS